jgi:hypothetical protein
VEKGCGVCTFASGGTACRSREQTTNGETGPAFCSREGGTWAVDRTVNDVCAAATATTAINNGEVSREDINKDLTTKPPVESHIIIVTVLTQAANDENGRSRFQTFVDVSGPTALNEEQKRAVCKGIANSLATHLGIDTSTISCELTSRSTKRAVDESYVADLTVGSGSNLQTADASVAASSALLALVGAALAAQ